MNHEHAPSGPIHDDHVCNHVMCLDPECGMIGRLVDGVWEDLPARRSDS